MACPEGRADGSGSSRAAALVRIRDMFAGLPVLIVWQSALAGRVSGAPMARGVFCASALFVNGNDMDFGNDRLLWGTAALGPAEPG